MIANIPYLISDALKKGRIVRPQTCSLCKNKGKIIGHHPDYSRPLYVIWVCEPCHRFIHSPETLKSRPVSTLQIKWSKKAFVACGNGYWLKCRYCFQWDDPKNMYIYQDGTKGHHNDCQKQYAKNRKNISSK